MTSNPPLRSGQKSWRMYTARDGRKIERLAQTGQSPTCPCCGGSLEAQPNAFASPCVILDATAYDLVCRSCHRFWCLVKHTPRSMQLMRMRRLVAAVRAVD